MSYKNHNKTKAFLGILEGKRKAVVEEEKRKTADAETANKLKLADVQAQERADALALEKEKQRANTQMYLILGGALVLVVGIAVYFKFRKK